MKSTGEVMGIDATFAGAYAKSQIAASSSFPKKGTVFLSVKHRDKQGIVEVARKLLEANFELVATEGTAKTLSDHGLYAKPLRKLSEGSPNVVDLMNRGAVQLVINTPSGAKPRMDEVKIRSHAVSKGIPCITTMPGAHASVIAIHSMAKNELTVCPMQDYHGAATVAHHHEA
jgi:carbamoyl-phosphate synthase large subunit